VYSLVSSGRFGSDTDRFVGATPTQKPPTALWYPVDNLGPFHRFIFKVNTTIIPGAVLIQKYRTRPILELLNVIKMPQPVIKEPISPVRSQMKQQGLTGCPKPTEDGVQKELYQVMLNMRVSALFSYTWMRDDQIHSAKSMIFRMIGGTFEGIKQGRNRRSLI
jgi:hypothetical protein